MFYKFWKGVSHRLILTTLLTVGREEKQSQVNATQGNHELQEMCQVSIHMMRPH